MKKILVNGGRQLHGVVDISGMKNSALPIIFACLLVNGDCILENMPRVSDVDNSLSILKNMGASVDFIDEHSVKINTAGVSFNDKNFELISKMRASSYLMSTCLSRFGSISMPMPGGCNFGSRPIDIHIKGFEDLGAKCIQNTEFIELKALKKPKSKKIVLDKISVGATINMIMYSVFANGEIIIENVAKEPHVIDLICFLNICGANIYVKGNQIIVKGVKSLSGKKYRIYSDMIEALTFVACVGITGGKVALRNVEGEHLNCVLPVLEKMGMSFSFAKGELRSQRESNLHGVDVSTAPYPGFPTDMHPQLASMLCYSDGKGSITDDIFPGRFAYALELEKMGAKIFKTQNTIKIIGSELLGANVDATDLRAGAALVLASLGAKGKSTINNVDYIIRGYEGMVSKLSALGADIDMIN